MPIHWGLDIGTNSLGWAIIDSNNNRIVDAGVRIFQEGVNEVNTDKEMSKNSTRRMFRQMRRHYDRRRMRKNTLYKALVVNGLAPLSASERDGFMSLDPYFLRNKAVAEKLELFEIGRVFYHMNQRRGFKSNRKTDKEDTETGIVKETIKRVLEEMHKEGVFTLGQHFHKELEVGKRVRGTYTARAMYAANSDETDHLIPVKLTTA